MDSKSLKPQWMISLFLTLHQIWYQFGVLEVYYNVLKAQSDSP